MIHGIDQHLHLKQVNVLKYVLLYGEVRCVKLKTEVEICVIVLSFCFISVTLLPLLDAEPE
jgi:hypothetical protein